MNKTVVMILGGAVLVAIIVAMLVQAKLSPSGDKSAAKPTIEILVATKKLETGTRLSADNVRWQAVAQDAVFPGSIAKTSEPDLKKLSVYGSPLRRPVEAGEPVTRQALIADIKAAGNYMAASLAPGMRAIALAVKPEAAVGGFISPGDRVDVIMGYAARFSTATRDAGSALVSRNAAQTIVNNARVMAVDQVSSEDARQAKVAKTITIEVAREDAERLVLAKDMGKVTLVLRRLGEVDTADSVTTPITTDVTTGEVMRKVSDAVKKSTTISNNVRVYSGTNVQNVPVRAVEDPAHAPAAR